MALVKVKTHGHSYPPCDSRRSPLLDQRLSPEHRVHVCHFQSIRQELQVDSQTVLWLYAQRHRLVFDANGHKPASISLSMTRKKTPRSLTLDLWNIQRTRRIRSCDWHRTCPRQVLPKWQDSLASRSTAAASAHGHCHQHQRRHLPPRCLRFTASCAVSTCLPGIPEGLGQ